MLKRGAARGETAGTIESGVRARTLLVTNVREQWIALSA